MRIVTDIPLYGEAVSTLAKANIELIVETRENPYNICAKISPEIFISKKDMSNPAKEFATCRFVYPYAKFPSYDFKNQNVGFNSLELFSEPIIKPCVQACMVNYDKSNKIFVQKINSIMDLHVYGIGFGINSFDIPDIPTSEIYLSYDICATTDFNEMLKILALGKKCIVPYSNKYATNIFNYTEIKEINGSREWAMEHTFFDVFSQILEEADPMLSQILQEKKKEIHATN